MRRPDPSHAIESQKAVAKANREKIAKAINGRQLNGLPLSVLGIARDVGLSPDTVRRSGDLYDEIKRWRSSTNLPVGQSAVGSSAEVMLRARLSEAQAEIADLRQSLARSTRAVHQILGEGSAVVDPIDFEAMKVEHSELVVALTDVQRQNAALQDRAQELNAELMASRELNRDYVRELSSVKDAALRAVRDRSAEQP